MIISEKSIGKKSNFKARKKAAIKEPKFSIINFDSKFKFSFWMCMELGNWLIVETGRRIQSSQNHR